MGAGYDDDIDISALERISLVECICRRPTIFIAKGDLRGILAWLEGYEVATRFAFVDNSIPDHYDMSPTEAMDTLAHAAGIERNGMPIHLCIDRLIEHYGGEDAVIEAMSTNAERTRIERRMQPTPKEK